MISKRYSKGRSVLLSQTIINHFTLEYILSLNQNPQATKLNQMKTYYKNTTHKSNQVVDFIKIRRISHYHVKN